MVSFRSFQTNSREEFLKETLNKILNESFKKTDDRKNCLRIHYIMQKFLKDLLNKSLEEFQKTCGGVLERIIKYFVKGLLDKQQINSFSPGGIPITIIRRGILEETYK